MLGRLLIRGNPDVRSLAHLEGITGEPENAAPHLSLLTRTGAEKLAVTGSFNSTRHLSQEGALKKMRSDIDVLNNSSLASYKFRECGMHVRRFMAFARIGGSQIKLKRSREFLSSDVSLS